MQKLKRIILYQIILVVSLNLYAGEPLQFNDLKKSIVPFAALQMWNTVSLDNQIEGEKVDNRFGMYFRRARIGLKGHPTDRLYYNVQLSADYLAKDRHISSKGSSNTGSIKVWSAYTTYHLIATNQWFNITTGYMLPHISREATTTPWTMSSLDKAETSCYLRRFATGKSNGISSGINLGGTGSLSEKISACYNIAFLNNMNGDNTQGKEYAPLLLGHAFFTIGDPELETYKYTTTDNMLSKKVFLSIGIGGSYQGPCDFFQKNTTLSTDLKINLMNFHLLTAYSSMKRKSIISYNAYTLLLRTGYNICWKHAGILEPTICYRSFSGDDNGADVAFYSGEDNQLDFGLNWWLNKHKLKLNAHYLLNSSHGNNFSSKADSNTKRGNLAVLGLQVVL